MGAAKRIGSFDGVRAIAVALVIMGHAVDNLIPTEYLGQPLASIVGNSSFGVRLFFVLSGYLITALLMTEYAMRGKIALGSFYARRTLRIFPAFYLYIGVMLLFVWLGRLDISGQEFLAAASYSWNYGPVWIGNGTTDGSWFLGHLWTLALEEQFYLCWPFLFILVPKRWLPWLPWGVAAVLPIVRIATYFLVPEWRGFVGMMFHTAIDSILIGCGFALSRNRVEAYLRCWSPVTAWLVLASMPLLGSPILRHYFGGGYSITLGFTVDAICVGGILVLLHARQGPAWVISLLEVPLLQWLGRLSYSLYLWQQPFLTRLNPSWSGRMPWCFIAALVVACLSYYCVERPILRWKRHFERAQLAL